MKKWVAAAGAFALIAPLTFWDNLISVLTPYWTNFDAWAKEHGYLMPMSAAIFAGSIAWISLRTNAAVNLRNKRADIIMHCNMRYDQLYEKRAALHQIKIYPDGQSLSENFGDEQANESIVDAFFRRYWGLQSDQLDYWFAGYVDPETMASWLMSISDSISRKERDGYHTAYMNHLSKMRLANEVVNQRLSEIVEFIENYASPIADRATRYVILLHYIRIIEREEQVLIKNLSRDNHRRFRIAEFSRTLRVDYRQHYVEFAPPGLGGRIRKITWPSLHAWHDIRKWFREFMTGESIENYKVALRRHPEIETHLNALECKHCPAREISACHTASGVNTSE